MATQKLALKALDLMTTSDGVHPNKDGYNYMAKLVFDFMLKKRIVQ